MKKIIILCFDTSEVLVYEYNDDIWETAEDFMSSKEIDINSNNCQWMIVDELNIQIK